MLKAIIVFLVGIAGAMFSISAFSQTYEYANLFNSRHTISIQLSPASFIGGDRAMHAVICSRSDSYVCITSDDFNFAVPVSIKAEVSRWEYKGYVYELKKQETLRIFGQTLKVWGIESVQATKKFRFLYSKTRGLMAFSVEMDGENRTFLSQKAVGFGESMEVAHH